MIQDRINPTAQIAIGAALVPARQCPFEDVLYEVVGSLAVAAQQSVSIAAQSWDVRCEQFSRVSRGTPRKRGHIPHRTTSNTEAAHGIAKCSQAAIRGSRSKDTACYPQMNLALISNLNVTFRATVDDISRLSCRRPEIAG